MHRVRPGKEGLTPARICPICGGAVDSREKNRAFPFCTPRCQLVDLSRWLDGDYTIPSDEPADVPIDED